MLDDVCFFAKNRHGQTMLASRGILARYGMQDEIEILGTTDFDRNPRQMARSYVDDDARILETGEPIFNRVELWFDSQGSPDWYVTHKLPICSQRGEIIGIMGILQSYGMREGLDQPFREIAAQIDFIRKSMHLNLRVERLAQMAGITVRQLERRFKAALGVGPQEHIMRTRILAASRALRETDHSLAKIATDCGFYDQSAFTRHFKKRVGQTPTQFRRSTARALK
ncbi:MAG: helix-turn-helix domain-containing protein [Planctomycetaceae bacterium]